MELVGSGCVDASRSEGRRGGRVEGRGWREESPTERGAKNDRRGRRTNGKENRRQREVEERARGQTKAVKNGGDARILQACRRRP